MSVEEKLPQLVLRQNSDEFNCDRRDAGWELVEDCGRPEGDLTLVLDALLLEDESVATGEQILNRAKKKGKRCGQHVAEMLLEQSRRIPEEWKGLYLIFCGTVWRDTKGRLCIPYLRWWGKNDGWRLRFRIAPLVWDNTRSVHQG